LYFDSTLINATLEAGVYYAQVARFDGNTNYNLVFSAISNSNSPLQIQSITPVKGSNLGSTTITVKGTKFTPNAQVSIIDANGTEILANKVNFQSDTSITATFNLSGTNAGNYDVKVVD
ncbi:MAG: IPT/TIG domain-containing protein, partial [Dolichospermum sp.]